jgi:hypothetical protein
MDFSVANLDRAHEDVTDPKRMGEEDVERRHGFIRAEIA